MVNPGKVNHYFVLLLIYNYLVTKVEACEPSSTKTPERTTTTKTKKDFEPDVCDPDGADYDYTACTIKSSKQQTEDFRPQVTKYVGVLVIIENNNMSPEQDTLITRINDTWKVRTWKSNIDHYDRGSEERNEEETMKFYVKRFMSSVNEKFDKEQFPNPRIELYVSGMLFNENQEYVSKQSVRKASGLLDQITTRQKMQEFFKHEYDDDTFDVVMLLYAPQYHEQNYPPSRPWSTDNRLNENRICSSTNDDFLPVLMIEDFGFFSGVRQATHEMGHLLGASEDDDPGGSCSGRKGYIMTNQTVLPSKGEKNLYEWSRCSKDEISSFMYNVKCLRNVPRSGSLKLDQDSEEWLWLTDSGVLPNADEQCNQKKPGGLYRGSWAGLTKGKCGSNPCQMLECDGKCKPGEDGEERGEERKGECEEVEVCAVQEEYYAIEGSNCHYESFCHKGNCITSN